MSNEPAFVHDVDIGDRAASVINVELGKGLAVVAICSALCMLAAVLSVWSAYRSFTLEKEVRMQQYYLLEIDAKVIAAGIKKPDESIATQETHK